ncbi:MAG: AMP-binding protein [Frankiaceae bacterium]|nr:AMP-binding protein [Arenimonas sp.]
MCDSTVGGVLIEAAAEAPDAEALVEARTDGSIGRRFTYSQLASEAERLADSLATRYAPGERIAIWSPNTPEWALLEFAAALAGLVLVTVNPAYQAKELAYVLHQSRSAGLFLVRECRGNPMAEIAREVCSDLPQIREVIDLDDHAALFAMDGPAPVRREVHPDDPAQVQYTSGTTGFPKGAVLSHRSLTNNARFSMSRMGAQRGDTYLNVMPMFHTVGCSIGLLGSVQLRCRLVMARLFEPVSVMALIETERVALVIAVPTMLIAMLEAHARQPRDTHSLRMVMSGGAMVPPELITRLQEAFGCQFTIIFGQTETSPVLTQTRASDGWTERVETIGQAIPNTELSIRDSGNNQVAAIGAIGEICARGYCNMLGYNDNPDATARAIDADGWLHTGDLGTMDARGYVRITGRLKDMIIRGGENMFPAEIENALITHPDIAEVAVVGVPDPRWGEIVIAFLRPRAATQLLVADLVRHVRRDLAAPKTPAHWIVLDAFPLTGSGKIQKFVLRDRYLAGDYSGQVLR